ncbi:DASH complex subunit Duo1-domain-containing protein [Cladorrhinum sp. PSN259]|nr:DASH complex subunit Duo1-domain-containing protein [Cladorrhinum sp. PSN259]
MTDNFDSSDQEDNHHLYATPTPASNRAPGASGGRSITPQQQSSNSNNTRFETDESREAALQRELEGVRNINTVIEGVISTLERAKGNMGTVSKTVDNASTLLNTWTRILSQTEHNQRLILNPNWNGATQDLLDIDAEALAKQQEVERRAVEAERRREEARRRAEEEERKRAAGASTASSSTTRGRGGLTRGRARGLSSRGGASSGYGAGGSASGGSSGSSSRPASGIGRGGFGYTRGAKSRGT